MFGYKFDLWAKTMVITSLLVAGVLIGYIYVNASGRSTSTIIVHMVLEEGVVLGVGDSLGPEEREAIKAFAIEKVVEDEEIGVLLAGKEYSVEARAHKGYEVFLQ